MSTATTTRTMPARFASTCGACGTRIAKGSPIAYRPGFLANHETCGNPTTPGAPRRGAGRSRTFVDRSGRFYGRCEDAPCCGCCS